MKQRSVGGVGGADPGISPALRGGLIEAVALSSGIDLLRCSFPPRYAGASLKPIVAFAFERIHPLISPALRGGLIEAIRGGRSAACQWRTFPPRYAGASLKPR